MEGAGHMQSSGDPSGQGIMDTVATDIRPEEHRQPGFPIRPFSPPITKINLLGLIAGSAETCSCSFTNTWQF